MIADVKLYVATFFTFLLIDFVWIGLLMKNFYIQQLRPIGRISGDQFEPVLWAAGVVYLALTIGIVHYVLPRLGLGIPLITVFLTGALFGLVVYATYDFTNYATLKEWTLGMTFTDSLWGATLCGLTTLVAYQVR